MGEHIPETRSHEEEATFWDKTGLENLSPDELEEAVVERPERPLSATFALRLDPKTVRLLRHVARNQGIGPTQLVRSWVLERLRIEETAGVLAETTSHFPVDFELMLRKKILDTLMGSVPAAVEEAMQDILERADQESEELRETIG